MDTQIFKAKFEAAVDSAKENKARGTQIKARISMRNGECYIFQQSGGSWFKYSVDEENGILQLGDRSTIEAETANEQQIKNVNYIDINEIVAFSTEYITETSAK